MAVLASFLNGVIKKEEPITIFTFCSDLSYNNYITEMGIHVLLLLTDPAFQEVFFLFYMKIKETK